jgi:hypothetical protein
LLPLSKEPKVLRRALFVVIAFAGCSGAGSEQGSSLPSPWGQIAVDDLHFIRATLRVNHPGPVDEQNPGFGDWFDQGFDRALALAERAQDYPGYYFAIQRYMVGFQDGHLGALGDDRLADVPLQRRWPGFLLGLSGDEFLVAESGERDSAREEPAYPPAGARLVECDGRAPDRWAEEILQTYVGLWSVRGARAGLAPFLLIDEGNPWVAIPSTCTFANGAETRSYELMWTPIGNAELAEKIEAARPTARPPIELRSFGEGRYWISLSSFNGNDDSVVAAIEAVLRGVTRTISALREARIIVFDVRGNHGGNSRYGSMVAEALWGESFIDGVRPRAVAVDWRVSRGNHRFLRDFNLARTERRFGPDAQETLSYAEFVDRFEDALERDEVFLTEGQGRIASPGPAPASPVSARIFLLTDDQCFSACLDFADILRAVDGVTHVGLETSADAIYIDNRGVELPSQLGRLGFSMKVYRDRVRGHNESYLPHESWSGDITDTPELERWIVSLAAEGA